MLDKINTNLKDIVELISENWSSRIGLFLTIILVLGIEKYFIGESPTNQSYLFLLYVFSITLITISWFYGRRITRNPENKIGILISIICSNNKDETKIREDFIQTTRNLINSGFSGNKYNIIEVPQRIAKSILNNDDATILRNKVRAHFTIFGRVRRRTINGKECYFLNLEGNVVHSPIDKKISDQISAEFRELFPREVLIPEENDLLSFSFTSEWTEIVAKYVIGIASFCSGDFNYAESIFTELNIKFENYNETNFPVFVKIKQRLPVRLSEIYFSRAVSLMDAWRKTSNDQLIQAMSDNLDKIYKEYYSNYRYLLLMSVVAFLKDRDIPKAKLFLNKCRKSNDVTWRLNIAFLNAYDGKLRESAQQYRIASNYPISPIAIDEIESFICLVRDREPDKFQLHYALGLFNFRIKGDTTQATKDFARFVEATPDGMFNKEKELSIKWIEKFSSN